MNTVTANVKSAWLSKVNWIQVVALGVTCATGLLGAFNLDPMTTAKLTAGVAAVGQIATIVVKTWYTTEITQASANKMVG